MRFNKKTRFIASALVIAAMAAGGAAFTDSNTVASSVAGYGQGQVSGGVVTSISYTLSSDGQSIDSATIVFQGDVHTDTAKIGFGTGASGSYVPATTLATCGTGVYDGSSSTTFTCDTSALSSNSTANSTNADISLNS